MKKVLALFVSFILVAVSFAQYDPGNEGNYGKQRNAEYNDRFKKDKDGRWRANSKWKYERNMEIDRINREYNRKIQAVQQRWFTSHQRKQRIIRQLEEQRRDEIRQVYERYRGRNKNFDDRDRNW